MKNRNPILLLVAACLLLYAPAIFSQLPAQHWVKNYGGSAVDVPFTIKNTADGGTIVAGYTTSKDGDVNNIQAREYWDLWIIKLDFCGNILWQSTFGGTGYESARDILSTPDGGYLVLGETNSTDGGVVAGYGGTKDIWLLKIDATGTLQWQKRIGGTGLDIGNQLYALDNGNFLIAGTTSSSDGDITGNHSNAGYTDGVMIKIDPAGTVLWSKCFGGSKNEELLDIEVIDGKVFIAGYANSVDGDIPANQKNYDVWLLTIDDSGNKLSSRIYGGSQNDVAYSMTRANDGSLTLAGYTTSIDGDINELKGGQDYWILNINSAGNIKWQKTFGGTEADYANYIFTDDDGGFVVGGISYSRDGDVNDASENGDFWLVKLSSSGELLWKQTVGGSASDYLRAMAYQAGTGIYYLAGDSESQDGDLEDNNGITDFMVAKFKMIDSITQDTMVCNVANFSMAPQIVPDRCGYDSAVVTYRAVAVVSPFEQLAKIDTIFEGGSLTLPAVANGNITWTPHPTLSCNSCRNPVASPFNTTTYTARMEVNECSATDQFTVVVLKDAVVRLPNAFTPNGDGINDMFGPAGKVPAGYELQIFNRNGEIVFRSSAMNRGWDGRYKGATQPTGAFVYVVRYKDVMNQLQVQKGTLMLIR